MNFVNDSLLGLINYLIVVALSFIISSIIAYIILYSYTVLYLYSDDKNTTIGVDPANIPVFITKENKSFRCYSFSLFNISDFL